ncbi:hypothetical protein SAMN04488063_0162 [Halopelagius inordinatus]|uniref:Uncharacterized protein n=1 Tax=Halopelagius inordinatus TaxID=553467 RepID=A0A1I2L8Z7_9EURY|nr:hypothetical protein [Halopelagius inordinatus]SFF75832.1 hypothetical protein SAMN04488063_0162 [Halopelagius inordinatus]
MRPRTSTVAVALLLVLAGCAAVSNAPTAGSEWVSPSDPLPDELPPGVSESGVDSDALLEANRAALEDESFALRTNGTDSVGSSEEVVRAVADRSRVRLDLKTGGPDREVFLDGETLFVRTHRGNDTAVRTAPRTKDADVVPDSFVRDDRLAQFARAAAHEPVGTVERDGETLVVLEADESDPSGEAFDDLTVETFRSQILVGSDGVVREFHGVVEGTDESGDEFRIDHRYALEELGKVSVEKPTWAEAD